MTEKKLFAEEETTHKPGDFLIKTEKKQPVLSGKTKAKYDNRTLYPQFFENMVYSNSEESNNL